MSGLGTAIWVTAAAGIGGTGLGGGAACLLGRESERGVSLLLSFAAGVMASVVCGDLLREALAAGRLPETAAGVLLGFGATAGLNGLLDRRRPGKGRLLLAGLTTALAIALHNVPEGMVIGASFASGKPEGGWLMALVIGAHNLPEGMAVAAPLRAGGAGRGKSAAIAALTGGPTVLGAALGFWLGALGPEMTAAALSFASGAMLYVVFGELLPESAALWRSKLPALAAVAGVLTGMGITG